MSVFGKYFVPVYLLLVFAVCSRGQTTLIHRYSFISNANDEVGTANGTVVGGATFNGSALVLNGTSGYVSLPAGVVSGQTAVTIETWASFGTIVNNSFLFGFGNTDSGGSGEDYIFCTPHGNGARAAISAADPGYTAEQQAAMTNLLDHQSNIMVAAVFNPPAHFIGLYINGTLVASNTAESDAMSVVNDQHSYIGHSLYNNDPYLNASLGEFRIFSGAPTNSQIAIDASAGPGQIVNYQVVASPGTLNSIAILGPTNVSLGTTAQLAAVGNYQNISNAYLLYYGQPTVSSDNGAVLTVSSSGLITPIGPGQAHITIQYGGHIARVLVTVPSPSNYTFTTFGEAFWAITNAGNGQVLTVNANGASQEAYTNGGFDQQFSLLYNYQNNTFRILQHSDWECIGAANGGTSPGTGVTTVNYSAQNSQQWYFVSVGNGLYRILNVASGYVLQTDNGNPASVTLQPTGGGATQLWGISYQTHYPKKGTAGYEGPPYQGEFQTEWAYNYNDNTGASESSNFDFVPMVDTEYWEPISDLQSRDSGWVAQPLPAALLGYNEPDNSGTSSTNPSTNQAAANWPSLMALDIPLVAPAMQNEEDAWESCFYDLVASNNLRVDYAACHLYVPPTTSSFISDIQSEYNAHGLPVWVTEFSPVDWNSCKCWSEDDDYNFLAEFMWEAESLPWIERYSVFPFKNTNPNSPWVDNGFTGSVFMSDGQTLSPYGELYATWDGTTSLQTNTPYLIHNLGASFRLTTTNSSSVPVSQDIYVRDASAQWALIPAPPANQYYIISLNDGRRLCNNGGTPGLAPPGTTNSTCQWWMNGPSSLGYYYIDNLSVSQSIEATGSPPAIAFGMINDPAPSSATEWRLIKPYQPVTIVTPLPPSVAASYTSQAATLTWSGNGSFYNVYRSTTSGGGYTQIASYVTNSTYLDNTLQNGQAYYYVVTSLNILGQESAYSSQVATHPASITPVTLGFNSSNNAGQNGILMNWPGDHTGWRLLMNTNGLSSSNWVTIPNSQTTNQFWLPYSSVQGVFFQLVYP